VPRLIDAMRVARESLSFETESAVPVASQVPVRDVTDPLLWRLTGALALAVGLALWRLGWTVNWTPFFGATVTIVLFAGIGTFFRSRDAAWARVFLALGLAMALAYTCQAATYVLGTVGAPFRSEQLARVGAWMGFSWHAWRAWLLAHASFHEVLAIIYPQHFVASGLALVVLALFTRTGATRFLRAFAVAFCVSAVGMVVAPALSWFPDAPSNTVRLALRAGTFDTLDFTQGVGLISFPSMHAALAVLVFLALWPFRRSRAPLTIFTALMLLSIPSEGGHYLVDVLAGIALGAVAWRAALT
jgi:membrane-associated phospholipid phosphatase